MSEANLLFDEDIEIRLTHCKLSEIMRGVDKFSTDMQISGWIPAADYPAGLSGDSVLRAAVLCSKYASFSVANVAVTVSAKGYGNGRGLFVKVQFPHHDDEADEEQ